MPPVDGYGAVCRYFASGGCYRDSCKFLHAKKEDCLGCEDKSACSKRHKRDCENELIGNDGNIIRGCDVQGCSKKHKSVNEQEKMVKIPESVFNDLKSNNLRLEARLIEQKKEMDLRYKELDLLYKERIKEIFELQDDIRNLNIQLSAADSEKKKLRQNCEDLHSRLVKAEEENLRRKSQDEKLLTENKPRNLLQDQKNSVLPSPSSMCSLLSDCDH